MANWLSRWNPLTPLIRRWSTPLEQLPLSPLVKRAKRAAKDSPLRRELLSRFAVTLIPILQANGIANPQIQLGHLLREALASKSEPDQFSAVLWDVLADVDPENARYKLDWSFFLIQFVHDTPSPARETLAQVLMRPPPPPHLVEIYAPTNDQVIAAFGSLWDVMLQHGNRDAAKLARRTKGFFKRSRVEKLKRRHDAGQSATC